MTPLQATLYSRPGCHLCEQAQAELARLASRHPHSLNVVDVSAEPGLESRYGQRIPVLVIGDCEYAAPLPRAALERALREAAASATATAVAMDASASPPPQDRRW
jgi:hypothetical protein